MKTLERMFVYASGESRGSRVVALVGCVPFLAAALAYSFIRDVKHMVQHR